MTPDVATASPAVHPRRFTSDDVQAMLRAGILGEDDRLELLHGQLVSMSPIGDPHNFCVTELNYRISRGLIEVGREDLRVSVQGPFRIDEHNEPEPDLVVMTKRDGAPRPDDVLLVVEVADSSLAYDRDVKLPLYASAGVPEVWIVNLATERVEVHRAPSGEVYRTRTLLGRGDALTMDRLPDAAPVPVSDVLPTPSASDEG